MLTNNAVMFQAPPQITLANVPVCAESDMSPILCARYWNIKPFIASKFPLWCTSLKKKNKQMRLLHNLTSMWV